MGNEPSSVPQDREDLPQVTRFVCGACAHPIRSSRPIRVGRLVRCPVCKAEVEVQEELPGRPKGASSPAASWPFDPSGHSPMPTPSGPRGSAADRPLVAGYVTFGEIGRGAAGTVYRARHEALDRVVALKVLRPGVADVNHLLEEAQLVARLHHPNIVQVFEVGDRAESPYLALEYVAGGTLRARTEGKPQPIRASARLVATLARAMQAAHTRGLVHRDLKPANILLTTSLHQDDSDPEAAYFGTPKITDFGLALRLDRRPGDRDGDDPGLYGTPHYMAPEQARGRGHEAGPGVDIYALGVILYELITGRRPFVSDSLMGLLAAIVNDPPAPLATADRPVPRDLEAICRKAMAKDSWDRYRSAAALADDLDAFLRGQPVQARPLGTIDRVWRWSLRKPNAASIAATAVVLLVIGLPAVHWFSHEMVRLSAIQGAEQQARTVLAVWDLYSKAIGEANARIKAEEGDAATAATATPLPPRTRASGTLAGSEFDLSFQGEHGGRLLNSGPHLLPAPATFVKLLGAKLHHVHTETESTYFKVYSDYPFRRSDDSPPPAEDAFGRAALDELSRRPAGSSKAGFEGDRLRYAYAVTLPSESCLKCHNDPKMYDPKLYDALGKTPKTDWKVGQTRGVLEIVRPMNRDYEQVGQSLHVMYAAIVGGAAVFLLACRWLLTLAGRRGHAGG